MNLPYSQIDGEISRCRWHVYWKGVWIATMFSRGAARELLRYLRWINADPPDAGA